MKKTKNIELVTFKEEVFLGFEIISLSEFYQKTDKNRQKSHIVNFYVILFITDGNGKHEINFKTYTYQKNNAIFINKGQQHRWVEYENTQGFIILFTEKFLQENQVTFKDLSYSYPYNSYLYKPLLSLSATSVNSFQTLVTCLYEEYKTADYQQKGEVLQCLLRTFLLKIKSNQPVSKTDFNTEQKELFIRFQKIIDDKIGKSRNVNDYCKWLDVSYKKLNEACKMVTQNTAKNFIDQVLLLKAKQLLTENKQSISEIAYLLSFEEPTNFTKFFKKHTNFSPKEFQKNAIS